MCIGDKSSRHQLRTGRSRVRNRSLPQGAGDGAAWAAFWLTGLASPLTIYALDFWEHSIGVALVGWGVVLLLTFFEGTTSQESFVPSKIKRVAGAGLLFGAAATLRTEALVYAAVAGGLAAARSRRNHLRKLFSRG